MSKIQIKTQFECESFYKDINDILKRIIIVRDSVKTEEGHLYDFDTYLNFKDLKLALISVLYEKTNLNEVLDNNKYTLNTSLLDKTFNGLDLKSKNLYKDFFSNLEILFETNEQSYVYFFPLNLKFSGEHVSHSLINILKLFNLRRIDFEELSEIFDSLISGPLENKNESTSFRLVNEIHVMNEPPKKEVLDYLKDHNLILALEVKAKNSGYSTSHALFKFESFLGFLSFAEYISMTKFFAFESDVFNNIHYDELVILTNNRITWPQKHMLTSLKVNSKKDVEFQNYNNLLAMYDKIKGITNKSLWQLLEKLFFLYYKASNENKTEYAFLNYWIIAETIIKADNKAKSNEEMKSIMKFVIGDHIIQKRIDFLDRKRNNVVHRGETVTVDERDLMKIIAEQLLLIAVLEMCKLKNTEQFGYYLSNFRKKNKERNSYIDVLSLLNSENDEKNNSK